VSSRYLSAAPGSKLAKGLGCSLNKREQPHLRHGGFMKTTWRSDLQFLVMSAFLVIGFLDFARAGELPTYKEVTVGINDAFVPGGFDSGSEAYVVVSGIFPNGCYQWQGAEVSHIDSLHHEIRSIAKVSQGMCTMVLLPFSREVRLGKLSSGAHELHFINGDGTYLQKTLNVE
jgi:hypothetical protein